MLLASCEPIGTSTASLTATDELAKSSSTREPPVIPMVTALPMSTESPTPAPTFTLLPTATPIPPSPTSTTIPVPVVSPLHTLKSDAIFQECSPYGPCVFGMRFSPDDKVLAIGTPTHIYLWDVTTGIVMQTLYPDQVDGYLDWSRRADRIEDHRVAVSGVVWNPDGTVVAAGLQVEALVDSGLVYLASVVALWDVDTGQILNVFDRIEDPDQFVTDVAFSPDGNMLASGHADGAIMLWDVATGEHLRTIENNRPFDLFVTELTWSPDGIRLAVVRGRWQSQETVDVWDTTTGQQVYSLGGGVGNVVAEHTGRAVWKAGGKELLVSGRDANILWDVASGTRIKVLGEGTLSPDSAILAYGEPANEQCNTVVPPDLGAERAYKSLSLRDAATTESLLTFECLPDNAWMRPLFIWSPDSSVLVAYETVDRYLCNPLKHEDCTLTHEYEFKSWSVKR